MRLHDRDVILADIPGIIEGASEGSGMGFRFLRHISRTKGLAYLVDLSDPDFLTAFDKLHLELSKYSEELAQKPYIIIGTKIDEDGAEENMKALREKYSDQEVLPLSIYMDELLHPVEEAFFRMADSMEGKVDNGGGFTSRMDLDAEYRDEE